MRLKSVYTLINPKTLILPNINDHARPEAVGRHKKARQ